VTVKLVQFAQPHHDVVDADFIAAFPGVRFVKVADAEACARELRDAEILTLASNFHGAVIAEALAQPGGALKWIQFTTTGIDSVTAFGLPQGVLITNVRGVASVVLGAHAIALMLAVMRGFHVFQAHRLAHRWARAELQGHLTSTGGGTAVICGMGGVGSDIARKAKAFDMRVIGVSRAGRAGGDFDRVVPREGLAEVLPEADVVFLALPYGPDTHHFIGARELAAMGRGTVLVNVARGGLVDENALIAALGENRIKGAGLDAFVHEPLPADSPLWTLENVVISPHVAGRGGAAQINRMRALFFDNLARYLAGRPLRNRVTVEGEAIADDDAPGGG
jgi:phosphoglycerate dehydrogenase-like enzyme